MEFEENKKVDAIISENIISINNVAEKKKKNSLKKPKLDVLDMLIVPVIVAVFVSLGFLFATLLGTSTISEATGEIIGAISSIG